MATMYNPEHKTTQGHTIQINCIEIYYEEYGVGKPLVLLHGFGGSSQNWHPFIDKLSEHYRLIVVDMRGHGHSTNPDNRFTHRDVANDVLLLLDKLEIDRFSAMGISSGGMTLLHMATSQSKRIDSMVLVSTTTHFPEQARAIMRGASFEKMPKDLQEMYRACAKRGDEQIHQLIAQFNALGNNYDDMNFTPQSLSTITTRTLIVHGDRDNFFPIEIPMNIQRSIPNAELWIILGGEHVPIYDSKIPFISTVLQFLDESNSK